MPYTLTHYWQFKLNWIAEYIAEHRQGKVQNWNVMDISGRGVEM